MQISNNQGERYTDKVMRDYSEPMKAVGSLIKARLSQVLNQSGDWKDEQEPVMQSQEKAFRVEEPITAKDLSQAQVWHVQGIETRLERLGE